MLLSLNCILICIVCNYEVLERIFIKRISPRDNQFIFFIYVKMKENGKFLNVLSDKIEVDNIQGNKY